MNRTFVDTMDDYCAPQWTDFTVSPQVSLEDFFEKEHAVHEPQPSIKSTKSQSSEDLTVKADQEHDQQYRQQFNKSEIFSSTAMELSGIDVQSQHLNTLQSVPVFLVSPSCNGNKADVQETTYDEILSEAMKQLQLSGRLRKTESLMSTPRSISSVFKTPACKDGNVKSASCRATINNYDSSTKIAKKTDRKSTRQAKRSLGLTANVKCPNGNDTNEISLEQTNRPLVTDSKERSITAVDAATPKRGEGKNESKISKKVGESAVRDLKKNTSVDGINNIPMEEVDETALKNLKKTAGEDITETRKRSGESSENDACGRNEISCHQPSFEKQVASSSRSVRRSLGRVNVLTCQYRRCSLVKYNRRSGQYVSLAEAVKKFQNGTPKRFRSVSNKDAKPVPLCKTKQASFRNTIPISPALTCKSRIRPVMTLSQEEREKLEVEEMKKHRIKANPVRKSTLKSVAPLKPVAKKPTTIPHPFDLTEVKRSTSLAPPKLQDGRQSKDDLEKRPIQKISVPAIKSTSEAGIVVENEKVLFFGVPASRHTKKHTHALPFSFESRNKEFQTKKEEKLKQLQIEEKNKMKAEFHARPVPKFTRPTVQHNKGTVKRSVVVPFSFEQRDKFLQEKKNKYVQQMLQEEKKGHEFHATPAPVLKPATVRSTSSESLRAKGKVVDNRKPLTKRAIPNEATKNTANLDSMKKGEQKVIKDTGDAEGCKPLKSAVDATGDIKNGEQIELCANDEQENKQPNVICNTVNKADTRVSIKQTKELKAKPVELYTDKRARERREFDERIKRKEMEDEAKRRKEEEDRLAEEKAKTAELRKQSEVKARPMPVYKPLVIAKSNKPLTTAQSPAWASKHKTQ